MGRISIVQSTLEKYKKKNIIMMSMTDSYTFSQVQEQAIILLNKGFSKTEVADRCAIARKTLYNWLEIPEFRLKLTQGREDTVRRFKIQAQHLLSIMSRGWEEILKDPDNKSYGKVSELLLKITGILDEKPNILFVVLSTADPYGQCQELMRQILERVPMLSSDQQQRLLSGMGQDDSIISQEQRDDMIVDEDVKNGVQDAEIADEPSTESSPI